MGETWDTYSKKLFRHVVHLGLPPAPAVRRTREPSLRAPEVRSTDAATVDSRTRQVTGAPPHLSYRPLPLRLATTTRRTRHSPSRICPFGRLVPFRAGCGPLAPAPRGCTDNGSDNARSTHNAARTRVTTTRTAHRCRVRHAELLHPPLRRHHRRTPVAASTAVVRAGRAASAPSEVRIAYWAMGVEPLRPERCTTMSVRRYSVYSASRASRVHAPYVRVSRAPAPGGCLRLSISRSIVVRTTGPVVRYRERTYRPGYYVPTNRLRLAPGTNRKPGPVYRCLHRRPARRPAQGALHRARHAEGCAALSTFEYDRPRSA